VRCKLYVARKAERGKCLWCVEGTWVLGLTDTTVRSERGTTRDTWHALEGTRHARFVCILYRITYIYSPEAVNAVEGGYVGKPSGPKS
jgi:hypothetical protein